MVRHTLALKPFSYPSLKGSRYFVVMGLRALSFDNTILYYRATEIRSIPAARSIMSHIAPPNPPAALARLGRRIQWLVQLYLCALVFGLTATTLLHPALLAHQPALAGLGLDPGSLDRCGRVAALASLAVPALPLLYAVAEALVLCRLMRRGALFTPAVPLHLRRMGIALVAAGALQPVGGALLSLVVSRAAGARHLSIALSSDPVGVAVIGAVLIAVAVGAREAVRLADENSRFV
jgi:hypothetical protein